MIGKHGIMGMYPPMAGTGTTRRGPQGLMDFTSPHSNTHPSVSRGPVGNADAFSGNPGGATAVLAAVGSAGTVTAPTTTDQFTFGGKKFRNTRKTLQQCYGRLSSELAGTFLENVKKTIKDMYELGFAFSQAPKGGFRTFKEQYDLPSSSTKAGPGESFHNYAIAVDLGCWQWIDEGNVKHKNDWWLAMKGTAYAGCDTKIWDKRDEFAKANSLVPLSWERIHLQGVPKKKSGSKVLCALLNKVAKNKTGGSKYKYQTKYKCDFGKGGDYYNIGTAKQMWAGTDAVSNADVKKAFSDLKTEQLTAKKKEIINNIKKDMQLASENWKQADL